MQLRKLVLGYTASILLVVATGCGENSSSSGVGASVVPNAQDQPFFCSDSKPVAVECQIAVIDKGPIRGNDPVLNEYRAVLTRLEPKCRASREQIASGAVAGKQLLKEKKGIEITTLKLLNAADVATADGNPLGVSCGEIIGTIAVMISR